MSTYRYKCKECGHQFEQAMALKEHEERHPCSPCPECSSKKTEQVPAHFEAVTGHKA